MKVLIAGSEGSLMQWVIPHLLTAGHEVVGVDNFSRYGEVQRARRYRFVRGDLCDKNVIRDVSPGIDAVIQGAAQIYGVSGFHKYPADILARDMELHQNLLWEALERKVQRFVYISSSMVYERCESAPTHEDDVEDMRIPKTDYGLSKLMGERLCRSFHKQYGLDFTIWRPFNIITPFERSDSEPGIAHVFADLIHRIIIVRQNPLDLLGDGEQIRCFTWIDDVARGIAAHSFSAETRCQVFNLGNPEPVTIKELARRIFVKAQRRGFIDSAEQLKFSHRPIYEDDVRLRIPAIEKAQRALGWAVTIKLDDALDRCIDAVGRPAARAVMERGSYSTPDGL